MTIDVQTINHADYVQMVITGTYDVREAGGQFADLIELSRKTGILKILVDFRTLKGLPRAIDKMSYALSIDQQYTDYLQTGGKPFRVAYLGASPFVSAYEPGLDLTKSRNLPFEIFTNEDEAYKWLNLDSPKQ